MLAAASLFLVSTSPVNRSIKLINIIDKFLPKELYGQLRLFATDADYSGEQNPVDGVIYPHICSAIPEKLKQAVLQKITDIFQREPSGVTMFLRASPAGVPVPHAAHHDLTMGRYSLMLYLNDNPAGGTALLRHKETGMCYAPESETFTHIARGDQNNLNAWAILQAAEMKQNRAAIFDAGYFHCALPVGGFGSTAEDQRVVLTVFFS